MFEIYAVRLRMNKLYKTHLTLTVLHRYIDKDTNKK